MSWLQASVKVAGAQIPKAVSCFEWLGALSVTQQNAGEADFFDLAHPAEPGWQRQEVVGLFSENESRARLEEAISLVLGESANPEFNVLVDQQWETAWIAQYAPTHINARLSIYPSAHPEQEAGEGADSRVILRIDPGLAFGTGMHQTTALCLDAISRADLNGARVLDMGCGSGILGIAAAKFGAQSVVGVDIDPKAEQVALENARLNGVGAHFAIQSAAEIGVKPFDLIVANILAGALIEMREELIDWLAPGGHLLLSGILEKQATEVRTAYQSVISLETTRKGEWVALSGTKIC